MKKPLIVVFVIINMLTANLNGMQRAYKKLVNYYNSSVEYLHNLIFKPEPKPEAFMYTGAFDEFTSNDVKEFNPAYKYPSNLAIHTSNLQKRWLPITNTKDRALLDYATAVIQDEKERNAWHKEILQTKGGKQAHYHETNIIKDIKGKPAEVKIRQDRKSPYYKNLSFPEEVRSDETRRNEVFQLNALENTAYHDELKFLQTQLHKIDLDWKLPTRNTAGQTFPKTPQDEAVYLQRRKRLQDEIEWLKSDKGRKAFTKSSMKKRDVRAIQEMRRTYEQQTDKKD